MQIQISWLLKKPTDLDINCLQNRVWPGSVGQGLILSAPNLRLHLSTAIFFLSFFFFFFFFDKLSVGKKFIRKVERLNIKQRRS